MAAERNFHFRREITNAPAVAFRRGKGCFGKADILGDLLHVLRGGQVIGNQHSSGIAALIALRKGCNAQHVHGFSSPV